MARSPTTGIIERKSIPTSSGACGWRMNTGSKPAPLLSPPRSAPLGSRLERPVLHGRERESRHHRRSASAGSGRSYSARRRPIGQPGCFGARPGNRAWALPRDARRRLSGGSASAIDSGSMVLRGRLRPPQPDRNPRKHSRPRADRGGRRPRETGEPGRTPAALIRSGSRQAGEEGSALGGPPEALLHTRPSGVHVAASEIDGHHDGPAACDALALAPVLRELQDVLETQQGVADERLVVHSAPQGGVHDLERARRAPAGALRVSRSRNDLELREIAERQLGQPLDIAQLVGGSREDACLGIQSVAELRHLSVGNQAPAARIRPACTGPSNWRESPSPWSSPRSRESAPAGIGRRLNSPQAPFHKARAGEGAYAMRPPLRQRSVATAGGISPEWRLLVAGHPAVFSER